MNPLHAFLWAVGQQESGGNYTRVNSGSGALGKYQVMPANVPAWTKEALGHSLTPAQFLASPAAQDAVAKKILGGYYRKYGAAGAASAWYSGNPKLYTSTSAQSGGPSVKGYVDSVLGLMSRATSGKVKVPAAPSTSSATTATAGGMTAQNAGFGIGTLSKVVGSLSPLGLLGDALGGVAGDAVSGAERTASKLLVSGAGLFAAASLVVIGLYTAVKGNSSGASSQQQQAPAAPAVPSSPAKVVEADPELAAAAL